MINMRNRWIHSNESTTVGMVDFFFLDIVSLSHMLSIECLLSISDCFVFPVKSLISDMAYLINLKRASNKLINDREK